MSGATRPRPPAGDATQELDPSVIYFTFSRIRPRFSCGRRVVDTLEQLENGTLRVSDLPQLTVLFDGAHYYSLNNRRLYCFKQLQLSGKLSTVEVRVRPVPRTKRMQDKYSPSKCALRATLKHEKDLLDGQAESESASGGSDEDGPECTHPSPTTSSTVAYSGASQCIVKGANSGCVTRPPKNAPPTSSKGKRVKASALRPCPDGGSHRKVSLSLEEELQMLGLQ